MREQMRWLKNEDVRPVPGDGLDRVVAAHPNEAGDGRVDVVVRAGAGGPRVELQLLAWGRGIGWYPQRRIALDLKQAQALRRSLVRAERSLFPRQDDPQGSGGQIIPFPGAPRAELMEPSGPAGNEPL